MFVFSLSRRRIGAAWIAALLALLPFRSMHAADSMALAFDEANRLFEQGKPGAAADAYEMILRQGATTPSVWFNLGNARYRNGEIGRSILAYLQASRLAPRDGQILANLQFARKAVKGADEAAGGWGERWIKAVSSNEWVIAFSAGIWVWFTCLALGQWRPEMRARLRSWSRVGAGWTLVCGALGGFAIASELRQAAVVVVREAPVRFTPIEESPVAFTATDGVELVVLSEKPDPSGKVAWLEVRDAARRSGWVRRDQVGLPGGI